MRSLNPGDVIFHEGEQHAYLYVILFGKVLLESIIPGHGSMPVFTADPLMSLGGLVSHPLLDRKPVLPELLNPPNF